jgi:DNA repair and recombination protein RAD52
MEIKKEQADILERALDRTKVAKRQQGGRDVFYVEGHYCIRKMNEIFGYCNWQRRTIRLENVTQTEENGRWTVSYLAEVEIEVGDTRYTGCGAGHGINQKRLGDAIESAAKEAETDAMKRAMICLGNQFGLALYDKTFEHVSKASDHIEEPKKKEDEPETIPFQEGTVAYEEDKEAHNRIDNDESKGKHYKFLRVCGEEKKRVGVDAYYAVLEKHGFKKSNQIFDRKTQGEVYNDLASTPAYEYDSFLDEVKKIEKTFMATNLIAQYDSWWGTFGQKPEDIPVEGHAAVIKALNDHFDECSGDT